MTEQLEDKVENKVEDPFKFWDNVPWRYRLVEIAIPGSLIFKIMYHMVSEVDLMGGIEGLEAMGATTGAGIFFGYAIGLFVDCIAYLYNTNKREK